jgi:cytochrome P450
MTAGDVDPSTVLTSVDVATAPQPTYAELLQRCPVARTDFGGSPLVYISRYDDVSSALRHPEVFTSEGDHFHLAEDPLIPLQVDPPMHTVYRRLLNPRFVQREVGPLEDDVRALARELLDGFADRGHCDFHDEFATPLPSLIFLRLMGLPLSDLPVLLRWRDNTMRPDVPPDDLEAAAAVRAETAAEIRKYFREALNRCRHEGGEGLLSLLVHGTIEGETGRALSESEQLGIAHLLLLGGLDTVTATLDCMVAYLARHDDERRLLVGDPTLIPGAVEEMLRYETPVMLASRSVTKDVDLGGVSLREGDHVALILGAANSDPCEFGDVDVDFKRYPNRHVAFGAGPHLCLGVHLARLELRVAIEELHRSIPKYRIPESCELRFSPGIRQPARLPLEWTPQGRAKDVTP